MREALRSGKEEVQAGNNQLRPRPRSPQRKARPCSSGDNVILFGQAKTLYMGPEGKGHGLSPGAPAVKAHYTGA